MTQPRRRRRTPEEALDEILDAAQAILLESGPGELKIKAISDQAGVTVSNVHHHFGGIEEVRVSLARRLLNRLADDLSQALADDGSTHEGRIVSVVLLVRKILTREENAKLIAWMALSSDTDYAVKLKAPLKRIQRAVEARLKERVPAPTAKKIASAAIRHGAATAIGEGLMAGQFDKLLGRSKVSAELEAQLTVALIEELVARGPRT